MPELIIIGDSLTDYSERAPGHSWVRMAAAAAGADLSAHGFPGFTTGLVWSRTKLVTPKCPEACMALILLGSNDACSQAPYHTSVDEYRKQLRRHITKYVKLCGAGHVGVIAPPPVAAPALGTMYLPGDLAPYQDAAVLEAGKAGVAVLRLDGMPGGCHAGDGLHLSDEGERWVGEQVGEFVQKIKL